MALTNVVGDNIISQERCEPAKKSPSTSAMDQPVTKPSSTSVADPMLLIVSIGWEPAIVEMEIIGQKLTNTIMDNDSGVNVLSEETWRGLGKPIL